MKKKILFTINEYDKDGDLSENGIFLHIDDMRLKVGKDLHDFDGMIQQLQSIREEMIEHHGVI